MRIISLRYAAISRITGIHQDTVRKAVQLYHKKGDRYVRYSAKGRGGGRPRKIPAHIEAELISYKTLNDMRFLSLPRRAELIRREHGIEIGSQLLGALYRRNKIRYLQAKKFTRIPEI